MRGKFEIGRGDLAGAEFRSGSGVVLSPRPMGRRGFEPLALVGGSAGAPPPTDPAEAAGPSSNFACPREIRPPISRQSEPLSEALSRSLKRTAALKSRTKFQTFTVPA